MSEASLDRYRPLFAPEEWQTFLQALQRPEPRTLRVRTARIGVEALKDRLEAQGFLLDPVAGLPSLLRITREPFPVSETLEHWLGLFYIQQAATALAAPLLDPQPGEGILDLCAAPGGKTTHLAELMQDQGCLVAVDSAERRVQALAGNVARLGHPSVITVVADALTLPESALFHRVLVDVPCSGEGRWRREEEPKEASRGDLRRLPSLQEALLRKAIRLTAPGGRILYVTCTLAPEENEGVVDRVLRFPEEGPGGSPPVRLLPLDPPVPHAPGVTHFEEAIYSPLVAGCCRIYPHHLDSGGLFMALLEREPDPSRPLPEGAEALPGWTAPRGGLPGSRPTPSEASLDPVEGEKLLEGLGVDPSVLQGMHWLQRGDALRIHAFSAWPLETWQEARRPPRILSAGLRALVSDRRYGLRPASDLLRWLEGRGVRLPGIELSAEEWIRLLDGSEVNLPEAGYPGTPKDGSLLLTLDGHGLARGRVRAGRLIHELPPPRARWLRNTLARRPTGKDATGRSQGTGREESGSQMFPNL
jgi:16S rRNA C967 or C1407 C5-methylase (RsmB/RsmF family)